MTDNMEEPLAAGGAAATEGSSSDGAPSGSARDFQLDLDELLQPISEDRPSGEFLRYEGTYDKIRTARSEDDASLPAGVWERTLKRADWQDVVGICRDALVKKTKDVQIAVWLTEALLYTHGFAGFREGLTLLVNLCEKFWDSVYPESVDNDDFDDRVSAFIWMNEKLSLKLKFVPVTKPQSRDSRPYNYWDWETVNQLEAQAMKDPEILAEAEAQGRPTRAKFLGSVMFSSQSFYKRQGEYLREIKELLQDLNSFLDERCGRGAPSFAKITTGANEIQLLVNRFLSEKKMDTSEPGSGPEEETGEYDSSEEEEQGTRPTYLSIRNRAEAYRMLSEAADYLLIHEPHSPTPYLVKRAVLWGHLTLTELLQELIGNEEDLRQILTLLGIRKPERQ